jgi:hypothetical protein
MRLPRIKHLDGLRPFVKRHVLVALDEIARPMTADEIDNVLKGTLFHSQRRVVAERLAGFDIIAIVHRQDDTESA